MRMLIWKCALLSEEKNKLADADSPLTRLRQIKYS